MFNYSFDFDSKIIMVPNFINDQELFELNYYVNRQEFKNYANFEKRNLNLYRHKIARLRFSDATIINKIAKRIYDIAIFLNNTYWHFNLDLNFSKADGSVIMLGTNNIEPHFLINQFGTGDSMSSHCDYHPSDRQKNRKIAFSLQLTNKNLYEGGELVLHSIKDIIIPKEAGLAIFYPSFISHEVKYVKEGIRRTIIYFLNGESFK